MSATHPVKTALGGNRLGSGGKMNITLHNYNRSTHNLSRAWRSSMTVGTLIPFIKELDLNGDTWDIDLASVVRTIPTRGPIYGSFKFQLDIFECPIRLYNALLHNNMINLGNQMEKVIFPHMKLSTRVDKPSVYAGLREQIANDSLLKYLGISGIGDVKFSRNNREDIERTVQAVPVMAYYDIYKNYYANKQEGKGVYITANPVSEVARLERIRQEVTGIVYNTNPPTENPDTGSTLIYQQLKGDSENWILYDRAESLDFRLEWSQKQEITDIKIAAALYDGTDWTYEYIAIADLYQTITSDGRYLYLRDALIPNTWTNLVYIMGVEYPATYSETSRKLSLKTFDLENIDNARIQVFRNAGLNEMLMIESLDEPYNKLTDLDSDGYSLSRYHLNGICLKTYQSDLLNNWLQTEWIDAINQSTAIDVSLGSFTIDSLNFAKKMYNLKNRVAAAGGTYQDWQEAVYTSKVNRMTETPVYKGGMSGEIVFSEVVSQSTTEEQPLGTLAGKGTLTNSRAGHVVIHCDEPSYIIGIASITPRIDYSQGNDWDMMELHNMDDLHKPELDGIGFEDLLQERGAWFGTYWDTNTEKWVKLAMGKSPAHINYMTALNKTYGQFAEDKMFMTLNRRYEEPTYAFSELEPYGEEMGIQDLTTYIDPQKYNYAFADARLEAQNFWVQIGMKIEARRVMSAKIIPQI